MRAQAAPRRYRVLARAIVMTDGVCVSQTRCSSFGRIPSGRAPASVLRSLFFILCAATASPFARADDGADALPGPKSDTSIGGLARTGAVVGGAAAAGVVAGGLTWEGLVVGLNWDIGPALAASLAVAVVPTAVAMVAVLAIWHAQPLSAGTLLTGAGVALFGGAAAIGAVLATYSFFYWNSAAPPVVAVGLVGAALASSFLAAGGSAALATGLWSHLVEK